jgi:cytochrome P450
MTGSPARRSPASGTRARQYPLGAAVTLAELSTDPHPTLARLRDAEPVSWVPVLNGWLVTRRDLALQVMRDSAAFTVDDLRFSTARVVGPSMLSLDGPQHDRHRRPFTAPFSQAAVRGQLEAFVTGEAGRLVSAMRPAGRGDLSRSLAAPLAVAVVARALGLGEVAPGTILSWYDAIVGAVSELAAADPGAAPTPGVASGMAAAGQLSDSLRAVIENGSGPSLLAEAARPPRRPGRARRGAGPSGGSQEDGGRGDGTTGLSPAEIASNAAVLMFGGIETTEGMIANAAWHLLSHPDQQDLVRADPGLLPQAIEESLRLEPAAAVVDRYATRDTELGGAAVSRGDLVCVSVAGAGRDPAAFPDPDRFDVRRGNAGQNLAFARGPHFCLGVHLARLEARAALTALTQLPGLRLDPDHPPAPRGLVFRKPPSLHVRWEPSASRPGVSQARGLARYGPGRPVAQPGVAPEASGGAPSREAVSARPAAFAASSAFPAAARRSPLRRCRMP